ncbi:hypothetical protein ACWGB8_13750 [Kitasatospora sp. NPDC054939]
MSGSANFFADGQTWVTCHEYGTEQSPILSITGGGFTLCVSGWKQATAAEQLAFARNLAAGASAYLAAVEVFAADAPAQGD